MEQQFRKIAENLSVNPSEGVWEKIQYRIEIDRLEAKQKRYKFALNWVAAAAVVSILFNAVFLSGIVHPVTDKYNYMAHSSLSVTKGEQPFHITTPVTIESNNNEEKRIIIRKTGED